MEVLKQNFEELFPIFKEAISDADFISIDTEFTGLTPPGVIFQQFDNMQQRYDKLAQCVRDYTIVQYGVCAFKKSKDGYIAKPFNFYVFGCDTNDLQARRTFSCSASSLSFLRSNKFDFNKLIDGGIPFYNFSEEESAVQSSSGTTLAHRHIHQGKESTHPGNIAFLDLLRRNLAKWLQNSSNKPLVVNVHKPVHRKLVYQEMARAEYNSFLQATHRDTKNMEISKITSEERQRRQRALSPLLNFRNVIEAIKDVKCPVVAHNAVFDLFHTVDQFWRYLPQDVGDFKSILNDMWETVVDTKYMAEFHPDLKQCFNSSVLASLYNTVEEEIKDGGPKVTLAKGYGSYNEEGAAKLAHEAGYDAYMTGVIYLGFVYYIHERERERLENEDELDSEDTDKQDSKNDNTFMDKSLLPYYNKLFLMRSDLLYMDLKGVEVFEPIDHPNRFFLNNVPSELSFSGIEQLYPELQPAHVTWTPDNNAWLNIRHDNKVELVKLGPLGEDRVREFLPGGSREADGTASGITKEASKIEILTFKQWKEMEDSKKEKDGKPGSESKDPKSDFVASGGSSYDDIGIPIPPSFSPIKKRPREDSNENAGHQNKKQHINTHNSR
ncbi:ribonuclease H-like domain-containing protein [Phycomyces nitens]|nr:ribonuclease H-like domain-containing protein [Phycomyces nitens]